MELARRLDADPSIDFPAGSISVVWIARKKAELTITMHFSHEVDGAPRDLEVVFGTPFAFQWEDEKFELISLPDDLPRCSAPRWQRYAYPIVTIDGSRWADKYAQREFTIEEYQSKRVTHYAFLALDDLVHVLSINPPIMRWVAAVEV